MINLVSTQSAVAGYISVVLHATPDFDNTQFYLSKDYGLAVTVGPDAVARLQPMLVGYTQSFANSWLKYKDTAPSRTPASTKPRKPE